MRYIIVALLLLFHVYTAYAQEVYSLKHSKDTGIFTGGYDKSGNMKLIVGNDIKYFGQNTVGDQTDQLSFKEFIDALDKKGLAIECAGNEPFWKLSIQNGKVSGIINDKEIRKDLTFQYANTSGRGWYMMFNSPNHNITGLISYCECMCDLDYEDETTPLDCHIRVDGTVYEGCAYITKTDNNGKK